jgi:hypothetical protein
VSSRTIFLLWLALAISSHAQVPILPEGTDAINTLLSAKSKDSLKCSIHPLAPFLDFTFRYEAGFSIVAPLDQFDPSEEFIIYLRVTPDSGTPVILTQSFEISPIPQDRRAKIDIKQLKRLQLSMSGAFAIGEGRYKAEVLMVDKQQRTCRKEWKFQAQKQNPHAVPRALEPGTVQPLIADDWDGKLDGQGIRLTVLMHVIPMNPNSAKLYAWDRGFLLQSLTSLLKQLPCQSVRIVAFNLDQQREIFRQDSFDAEGFAELTKTLQKLELATVSYKGLQRGSGPKMLVHLAREQTAAKDSSDAVVFLGPSAHFEDKVPQEMVQGVETGGPRFFYFEYYPWVTGQFPDSIDYLTRSLHGTVYRIHSPDELARSIQKMLAEIKHLQHGQAASQSQLSTSQLP